MLKERKRLSSALAMVVLSAIVLAACGSTSGAATRSAKPSPHTPMITIPQGQELFMPFILTVPPNTIVTWLNNDTASHTIMTTWDQSAFLNPDPFSLTVAAGHTASFTFTKPGVYDYFDNSQAKWDTTDHRVAANKDVPNFPLAMEGVIWVQGPISNLAASATNVIPSGKDEFTTDFTAITKGGTVTWHNRDTDQHFLSPVVGWSAPINPISLGVIEVKGTHDAPPNGETATVTFSAPGLYYYYCSAHASINTTWNRAQAHQDASEAPIPMEGFVLVVDNRT